MNVDQKCVSANDFAPHDDQMHVYFKHVAEKKSDGFAIVINGEIYLVDCGRGNDRVMFEFLGSLREAWLSYQPDASLLEDESVKLEVNLIISHMHPDHMGCVPAFLSDPRFRVLEVIAPPRARLGTPGVEGALQMLVDFEERSKVILQKLEEYGHVAREIKTVPYGSFLRIPLKNSEAAVEIYAAPFDWSEDRENPAEGLKFIKSKVSATYGDRYEMAYTNGILNGNSFWVKAVYRDQSVLITGDQRDSDEMTGSMIRYHGEETFRCDVLKYLHHAEKNYCPYLMEVTKPKITVFTCEDGLEHPDTRALCKKLSQVYYACDGNLVLTLDGESILPSGISPRI